MVRLLLFVYWAGLLLGVGVTLYGLLAPLAPRFDLINHFRPFTILACFGLLAIGLLALWPGWPKAAIGLALVNLALAVPALAMTAGSSNGDDRERIRVLSINLWISRDYDGIVRLIERENPDLLMLQEVRDYHVANLLPRLATAFPHIIKNRHDVAVLARTPLRAMQQHAETVRIPALVTARWTSPAGTTYRVGATHFAWPFQPDAQLKQVDWLADAMRQASEPVILAGDFNLSPWSYMLTRLTYTGGLRQQGLIGFTWPSRKKTTGPPWPPAVLIDNVLTSPGIFGSNFRVHEDVGSDHRPVSVDLYAPSSPPR